MTPMVATLVLFDLVVQNSTHAETKRNLVYLDIAAGYFQRLDLAVDGSPVGYLIAEFSTIAKDYVRRQKSNTQQRELDQYELQPESNRTATASHESSLTEDLVDSTFAFQNSGEMNGNFFAEVTIRILAMDFHGTYPFTDVHFTAGKR
jgi:hypothetical protein